MTTAILVPVLRRPQNVRPLLASIATATPEPHRVIFICNSEDTAELAAIGEVNAEKLVVGRWKPGDYARKINAAYRATTDPLLFLAADDLKFHPGWLSTAISYLNSQIHVVGTNDLGNPRVMAGRHSTHSLVTREYVDNHGLIDKRGQVLCELYPHTFTDDEFVQTAQARQMFAHAPDSIVEHLHPNWKKGPWDEVYSMADQSLAPGRRIFRNRRHLWRSLEMVNVQKQRDARRQAARQAARQTARG